MMKIEDDVHYANMIRYHTDLINYYRGLAYDSNLVRDISGCRFLTDQCRYHRLEHNKYWDLSIKYSHDSFFSTSPDKGKICHA